MSEMTPREIVSELDKHIIGQDAAKRSVAIALRNRWRRMQLNEELRHEVTPKNILMIGPTGVGKTEIARRLAKLANAPFIKVEATKFTEVGYVGKEVDSIIRDLTDAAIKMVRMQSIDKNRYRAEELAEERVLDVLIPPAKNNWGQTEPSQEPSAARQAFRKKLREGQLDDKEIEIDLAAAPMGVEIMSPPAAGCTMAAAIWLLPGTSAYFTDHESVWNRMVFGHNTSTIDEEFPTPTPVPPGKSVVKRVKIRNEGSVACYIRAALIFSEPIEAIEGLDQGGGGVVLYLSAKR